MKPLSLWPAVLGLAAAMILVTLLEPTQNSLAYASGILALIALFGWIVEAREIAGPPPEVEPEVEEEERPAGPSYWPIILAAGIVGIAAGLVYDWDYGALMVAVPLTIGSGAAWLSAIKEEMESPKLRPEAELAGPAVVVGGRIFRPLPPQALMAQAVGGASIAIERVEAKQISRSSLLRLTFWTGLLAGLVAGAGSIVDMLYPRGVTGFGSVIAAGTLDQFPAGTKKQVPAGKFWLVSLNEEQGGPGLLALWWKCPHLGCTVPWRPEFSFIDPQTGQERKGWFRCPCHGSTYTDAGVRVFGPAPRSMDMMELTVDSGSGRISVSTGKISKGQPDNQRYAVKV